MVRAMQQRARASLVPGWLLATKVVCAVLWSVALLSSPQRALAQDMSAEQLQRAQDITRTTMSPFCPGRTLDACPSEYATQWRKDIRQWVSEGVPAEEIKRRLDARTDHDLTGAPSTSLDAVLPWLVAVLALCLLVLLLRVLVRPERKQRRGQQPDDTSAATGSPAAKGEPGGAGGPAAKTAPPERPLDERLDDELRSLDD